MSKRSRHNTATAARSQRKPPRVISVTKIGNIEHKLDTLVAMADLARALGSLPKEGECRIPRTGLIWLGSELSRFTEGLRWELDGIAVAEADIHLSRGARPRLCLGNKALKHAD